MNDQFDSYYSRRMWEDEFIRIDIQRACEDERMRKDESMLARSLERHDKDYPDEG